MATNLAAFAQHLPALPHAAVAQVSHFREQLANVSGAVSIACWVTILLPQLLEQWRLKSADGVAISFLLAWFFGDLANLAGAIIGQLRPGVILLAVWFCFSDTLLVLSYYYYKHMNSSISLQDMENAGSTAHVGTSVSPPQSAGSPKNSPQHSPPPTSSTPLLQEPREADPAAETSSVAADRSNWLLSTGIPGVFVLVVATLSYFISDSEDPDAPATVVESPLAEFLGYFSAVLYLVARIPQMLQNHRRRSVEGLSMGFFTLSVLGNLTYAGQVIVYRTDAKWLRAYLPWLLGSLGTIIEDLVILAQFHIYRKKQA